MVLAEVVLVDVDVDDVPLTHNCGVALQSMVVVETDDVLVVVVLSVVLVVGPIVTVIVVAIVDCVFCFIVEVTEVFPKLKAPD